MPIQSCTNLDRDPRCASRAVPLNVSYCGGRGSLACHRYQPCHLCDGTVPGASGPAAALMIPSAEPIMQAAGAEAGCMQAPTADALPAPAALPGGGGGPPDNRGDGTPPHAAGAKCGEAECGEVALGVRRPDQNPSSPPPGESSARVGTPTLILRLATAAWRPTDDSCWPWGGVAKSGDQHASGSAAHDWVFSRVAAQPGS